MTPITDGITDCNNPCTSPCTIQNNQKEFRRPTAPLITATYKEGSGDRGNTSVSYRSSGTSPTEGLNIGIKGLDIQPELWARLSKLQVSLLQTIPYFTDADTKAFLQWVWENIRSLSSLVHLSGVSQVHSFPMEAIHYMEICIQHRKTEFGPSQSFIQWEHPDLLQMESLWCEVRHAELYFQQWSKTSPVQAPDVILIASITLNRLSSYLWWQMRSESKARGLSEHVWQGYVTPFPLSL
jgi:cob(I)alamin adenosyltransferase